MAVAMVGGVGKPVKVATVGMSARLDQVVIEGAELEAKPQEDRGAPMVLRVVDVYPHGPGAFRYDLEFYGLEPGIHDLGAYLRRKDGKPREGAPQGPFVEIVSILPPGQVPPREPPGQGFGRLGGYRLAMIGAGLLWAAGLVGLIWMGRKKAPTAEQIAAMRPPTLADRLRPLVEQATAGTLGPSGLAELERLLMGHWRKRLGLVDVPAAVLVGKLRQHEEAGPLIRQLEEWLHAPGGGEGEVDVAGLLAPYRDLPADPEPVAERPEGALR